MSDPVNKWNQPEAPPPPMFFGKKERDLVKQVNDELAERVIGQEIAYYPISIEESNFNEIYGEAIDKVSLPPVRVYAYVEVTNEQTNERYGYEYQTKLTVNFHRKRLTADQNLFVRVGDFVQYGSEFYEIVKTYNDTRYYFGQVEHKFQISAECIRARQGTFRVLPAIDRKPDRGVVAGESTTPAPRVAPIPPINATYITVTPDSRLSRERVLTAGAGITLTDAGANSTLTIASSGQNAVGPTGSVQFTTGGGSFSGSHSLRFAPATKLLELTGAMRLLGALTASTTIRTTELTSSTFRLLPRSGSLAGSGSYLGLDNNNNVVIARATATGGSGTPGGSTTQIQYNSAGAFAGSSNLTFNGTTLTGSYTGSLGQFTTLSASSFYAGSRVGIGTASPGYLLEVSGGDVSILSSDPGAGVANPPDGRLLFDKVFDNSGEATANKIVLYDDGGVGPQWKGGIGVSLNDIDFFSGDNFRFWTNHGSTTEGDNRVTILANGNVGIGTDAPDYALHVAGQVGIDRYIYHNGDADTYLSFTNDEVNIVAGGKSVIKLTETGTNDKIKINNTNADIDLQVMADDGEVILHTDAGTNRVGINTDAPTYALDVAGDAGFDEYIYHNGDTNTFFRFTNDRIYIEAGGENMLYLVSGSGGDQNAKVTINNDGVDVDFQVKGLTEADLIRVDAINDRVGIGARNPSHLLTVGGSSHLSGGLVHKRTAVVTSHTASATDYLLGVTGVPTAILLNASAFTEGQTLVVKDESGAATLSNPVTLNASGVQTIDGASSVTIDSAYGSVLVYTNGSNWFIY